MILEEEIVPFKENNNWFWLDKNNIKQPFSPTIAITFNLIGRCLLPEDLINQALNLKNIKKDKFKIFFTEEYFLRSDCILKFEKEMFGGYLFLIKEFGSPPSIPIPQNTKIWLCNVFDDYVKNMPENIYLEVRDC